MNSRILTYTIASILVLSGASLGVEDYQGIATNVTSVQLASDVRAEIKTSSYISNCTVLYFDPSTPLGKGMLTLALHSRASQDPITRAWITKATATATECQLNLLQIGD